MPATPFVVYGTILDSDAVTPLSNVRVSIQNVSTNETSNVLTDANGQYQYDLANLTSGYALGNDISVYASYGRNYKESTFKTATSDNGIKLINLTLDTAFSTSAVYCSVQDVRDFTNVNSSEFSDNQIMKFIRYATDTIDQRTARTWKGIQTVTDELYNGDDTDMLTLAHPDIQSVTAISVDDDGDRTFTTLTSSVAGTNPWFLDNQDGYTTSMIVIDTVNANLTNFTAGVDNIKVSYTWGFATPTVEVNLLCILMVCNMINRTDARERDIESRIKRLAYGGPLRPI